MAHRVVKSWTWLKQLSMHAHSYQAQQQNFWFLIVVVESLSCVQLFVTPWTAACQASLSFTTCQSLLRFMSIESVMPSNHLILCRPLLLLPSIFPSIRVFSNESSLHIRWSKYWSFNFSISSSNKYSVLISFRIARSDLLPVQGTLKSLNSGWFCLYLPQGQKPVACRQFFCFPSLLPTGWRSYLH